MKHLFKKLLCFVLVASLCVPVLPAEIRGDIGGTGVENTKETPKLTPATSYDAEEEEFVYSEDADIPEGFVSNYMEVEGEINSSFANVSSPEIAALTGALPSSYTSVKDAPGKFEKEADLVTSVKDQNPYGTCWAFGATSVAEASYHKNSGLKASKAGTDWNEYHLVYFFYNTPKDPLKLFGGDYVVNNSEEYYGGNYKSDLDLGGNNVFTIYTFANWIGASANTSFDAQDVLEGTKKGDTKFAFKSEGHMQNGYYLTMPDMNTSNYKADMNIIKEMIMEHGSVAIAYCAAHQYPYWNELYQYCPDNYQQNHAVTIVGWNDNIKASKFETEAPGKGAWLVKNSWGTWFGDGGYFWLSYYDTTIDSRALVYDFETSENYDNNYQYDGGIAYMRTYSGSVGANAFTADSNELIEAVGFYTYGINYDYEIRVYTDLGKKEKPQDGKLALKQKGSEKYVGYHTVDLKKSIAVEKGERYAIVISFSSDDSWVALAADTYMDNSWILSYSFAKARQSYAGYSIDTLEDINPDNTKSGMEGTNLRIKAFTNENYLVKDAKGNLYYKKNGKTVKDYDGIATNEDGTYYVENGKVDFSKTGIYRRSDKLYYFKKGKVYEDFTGIKKKGSTSYYVKKGEISEDYKGAVTYKDKTYYVNKSKVDTKKTGVYKLGSKTYYFVKGIAAADKSGFVKVDKKHYYMKKGVVQTSYTGLVKKSKTLYYVEKGVYDSKFDGVAKYENKTYYVNNGKAVTSKTGIYKRGSKTYFFKKGVVLTSKTGLIEYKDVTYYMKKGVVQTQFTGVVKQSSKYYYVIEGKVDFKYTGTIEYKGKKYKVKKGIAKLID